MTDPRTENASGDILRQIFTQNADDQVFLTDRGNGRRLVELLRDTVRYVIDEDKWLVRQGNHWVWDDSGTVMFALTGAVIRDIRREALETQDEDLREGMLSYAIRAESENVRKGMISSAREHPEVVVSSDMLDADPNLLATPDGVIDLRTGEHRAVRPDELHTRWVTVPYDPGAESKHLDLYRRTFVPEPDDWRTLSALMGSSLHGDNRSRIAPILYGGTTSGKSQLVGAVDRLLGDYACTVNVSIFRGNLDDKGRPDLIRVMHHRVAFAMEASKTWEMHADQLKRLTGATDKISHRNLYGQIVEKVPRFTPIIVTNEIPRVKGVDAALRKRVIAFEFDRSLPPELEDTRVRDSFINDRECQQALLAALVRGARDEMFRDGVRWDLASERLTRNTMASFDKLEGHLGDFLEWMHDRGALVPDAQAPLSACAKTTELHEWYVRWVKKHGDKSDRDGMLNEKGFRDALENRGWTKRRSSGTRWVGIKLTETPSVWGL